MRALVISLVLGGFLAGCAWFPLPGPARTLLTEADSKLAAEDWNGASTLYRQFLEAYPDNSQAGRVRATRVALERLRVAQAAQAAAQAAQAAAQVAQAAAQASLDRDVPKMRRELSDRQSEVDQLKGEVAKLRADLERLRSIDLQDNKPGVKK